MASIEDAINDDHVGKTYKGTIHRTILVQQY